MAKEKELQEQLTWFRNKYKVEEPELPLSLDAQVLKQRALSEAKPRTAMTWKKLVPMACGLVLAVAVSLSGGFSAVVENNSAAPEAEAYMVAEAAMPQAAAYTADAKASSMMKAVEYSVEIETHLVGSGSKAVLRELYPGVKFYSLSFTGDFWTVIHVTGAEGEYAVAVRADETEVSEGEHCYIVHDMESGKELRFDLTTLEQIK